MKQLQNNYTTPEYSKQLLKLGVPADSADCFYEAIGFGSGYNKLPNICGGAKFSSTIDMPCWSVGRMIEIYNICANSMPGMQLELDNEPENCTYIEMIISSFELAADDGLLDFSKLED